MNDKFKELTKELTLKLEQTTNNYMLEAFQDGEETILSDLFNLLLNGHLSSLYSSLILLVQVYKEPTETIDYFMNRIFLAIGHSQDLKSTGDKH